MSTTRDDLELEQIKAHIEEMRANVEHMRTTDRIEERRRGWYRVLVVAAIAAASGTLGAAVVRARNP